MMLFAHILLLKYIIGNRTNDTHELAMPAKISVRDHIHVQFLWRDKPVSVNQHGQCFTISGVVAFMKYLICSRLRLSRSIEPILH